MNFASESNSMMGPIGSGAPAIGWTAIAPLSERRLFRLYTAVRGGRRFVLKALREPYCDDPAYIGLLEREVALAMRLDHPNIVRVEGVEDVPTVGRSIVMERIEGMTLGELKKAGADLGVDRDDRRRMARELADALAYAHEMGVSHRDLKPDNVMITRRGNHVKVIDFGLGDADDFVGGKGVRGTRRYGAPEQLGESTGEVDVRADVWSFGCLLRDLDCGRRYDVVARRCLRENPDERPSMAEVSRMLAQLRLRGESRMLYVVVGLIMIAIVALVGVLLNSNDGTNREMTAIAPENIPMTAENDIDSTPVDSNSPQSTSIENRIVSSSAVDSDQPTAPVAAIISSPNSQEGLTDEMKSIADGALAEALQRIRQLYLSYYSFVYSPENASDGQLLVDASNRFNGDLSRVHEAYVLRLKTAGISEARINELRNELVIVQSKLASECYLDYLESR